MKDIISFKSKNPSLFYFHDLIKEKKIILVESNEDIIKNKKKHVLFYSKRYNIPESLLKIIERGAILIALKDLYPNKKRTFTLSRIKELVKKCIRTNTVMVIATLAENKSMLRNEWERTVIGSIFMPFITSKRSVERLEEFI